MNRSRLALVLISIVSVAGIVTAFGTWLHVDGQKLRVGYVTGDVNHAVVYYARAKGMYYDAGLDLKLSAFSSEKAVMDALDAGQIDIAYVGLAAAVYYRQVRETPITVIAAASTNGSAIVVQGNSSIMTPAHLSGKTIAIPATCLTQDLLLHAILNSSNVKYGGVNNMTDDVDVIEKEPYPMLLSLNQSRIDAFISWESIAATGVYNAAHGTYGFPGRYLLNSSNVWPDHPSSVVVARAALLGQPALSDVIIRFLRVHVAATIRVNSGKVEDPSSSAFFLTLGLEMSINQGDMILSLKNTGFDYCPSFSHVKSFIGNMTAFGLIGTVNVDTFVSSFYNTTLLNRSLLA